MSTLVTGTTDECDKVPFREEVLAVGAGTLRASWAAFSRQEFGHTDDGIVRKMVSAEGLEPSTHALKGVAARKTNNLD